MPQRSIRLPDDLHDAIKAEAERRGRPHSFSSVLIEVATAGVRALESVSGATAGTAERAVPASEEDG